jgi:alpha-acetolactate decarboxylase
MTLAVMGYHLQVITDKLGETVKGPVLAGRVENGVTEAANNK